MRPASPAPAWRTKQARLAEVMARVVAANAAGRAERERYVPHGGIRCLLDTGPGAGAAYVHRDAASERLVPVRVVGHALKKGGARTSKESKREQVARLPGM